MVTDSVWPTETLPLTTGTLVSAGGEPAAALTYADSEHDDQVAPVLHDDGRAVRLELELVRLEHPELVSR